DEMTELYQEVATDLSVIRSGAPDAAVIGYLSALLAKARTRAGGVRVLTRAAVAEFFVRRFPAALYRTRRWGVGTMAISYAVTAIMIVWLLNHPQAESQMMSPEQVQQLVSSDFESYYSTYAASHFAAQVWTNNVFVSVFCIAFGVLGAPVLYFVM